MRFFVGLSSGAAILGNPGQSNYAAANRMMSALLSYLGRNNSAIRFKALMLPPVEGAGMADDPAVRELMQRKGVGYIQVNELAGLFCREPRVAPADDDWVMFMRTATCPKKAARSCNRTPALRGELGRRRRGLHPEDFPLIDRIARAGPAPGKPGSFRTFPGTRTCGSGSPAPQVHRASSGLSRHGFGDLHGSRPAPVSPPAGARGSPGALPGHDRMSTWGAAEGENPLPPSRHLFAGGLVRGLSPPRRSPPPAD